MATGPRRPALPPTPETYSPLKLLGFLLVLVATSALAAFGITGLFILSDPGNTYWVSTTPVGDFFRWVVSKNPFFVAFFVNGGLLGVLFSCLQIGSQLKARKTAITGKDVSSGKKTD